MLRPGPHPPTPLEAAAALLAGIAPDLDQRQGMVGRLAPWLSGPIEHAVWHRTATHSLAIQLAVLIPSFAFLPFGHALALASGPRSHALSDMMTEGAGAGSGRVGHDACARQTPATGCS